MDGDLTELKELLVNHDTNISSKNEWPLEYAITLLEIVENNDVIKIQHIIQRSTIDLINHRYRKYNNKNILTIACTEKSVSKETLDCLCREIKSHHSYLNCLDENWYKWEPLHHVARIADPEKLQVLIKYMDSVNSLTTYSENALHVLLEYEESVSPFNTLLYNGSDSRECTIINTEKENMVECARILIDEGIDVNHSNFWNDSPICLAVRYRYIEIIKLLLKTPYIDIDNYKEGDSTIREYLKQNYICQDILPQSNHLQEDPVKLLFNFLKSGDEESFLHFKNGNIKDFVDSIDGDSEHNSSGNMLQFCFKKGFLEYLQHDMYSEELTKCDILDSPMLIIFYTKGLGRCIEHLLNNGADPKLTNRKFPESLLEAAVVRGYYPLVAILLQHKSSKITPDEIYDVLTRLFNDKHELKNHDFYRKHVLCLLLNKLLSIKYSEILSSQKLDILHNVLCNLNLESDNDKHDDSNNICQILHLGASLTNEAKDKKMILERLHPDILNTHLDDCIDNNVYSYNSIIEDKDSKYSEIKALSFLVDDAKTNKLLRHPLLVYFIHNKWLRIFYFYYFDLFLYTCFLLIIYAHMITVQTKHDSSRIVNLLFYIFLALHTLKECAQLLFLYHLKYFLDVSNYLELTVIGSCLITIFYPNEYAMVIAILFSTVIFFIFLGQLPLFAKYTIIFGSAKYFLQYAGFYFVQFISFALVFYIIFPIDTKPVDDASGNSTTVTFGDTVGGVFKSLFYTLILFTGEFNERVLEPEKYPVFGRIITTVFIFCMTIILNNLLVGLIVADMDDMQKEGKLYKQITTANFIIRMNFIIKRLHEFRSYNFIKTIINFFNIFKKGKDKFLNIDDCTHSIVFDAANRKYLKDMRSRKTVAYDKDILKKLYTEIQNETSNSYKKIKEHTRN